MKMRRQRVQLVEDICYIIILGAVWIVFWVWDGFQAPDVRVPYLYED